MSARDRLIAAWRKGREADISDVVATIETEVEIESFRAGLKLRGALTGEAMQAIEQRRYQLQKAKGVSWRS